MHKYPQNHSYVGSSGQTLTTNVSMTLCDWQICHQTHILCGCTTFGADLKLGKTPPPRWSKVSKTTSHTGSSCLDKPVLARDAQHKKTLQIEKLPVPHTKHNSHKHGTRTRSEAKFCMVLVSLLPMPMNRCGIETLSNLVLHLKRLHMIPLCGRLQSKLGCRLWNRCRLPILGDNNDNNCHQQYLSCIGFQYQSECCCEQEEPSQT